MDDTMLKTLKFLVLPAVSAGWIAPLVWGGHQVLRYLHLDLAALHYRALPAALAPGESPEINDVASLTEARTWLLVAAVWLALVIVGWTVRALRVSAAARVPVRAEPRTTLPAVPVVPGADRAHLDARFGQIEVLLARQAELMERRLGAIEALLARGPTLMVPSPAEPLRPRAASVNQSDFGDFATGPAPFTADGDPVLGPRLRDLVLNLSHLQEDLRTERRRLRRRMQDLADAGPHAA